MILLQLERDVLIVLFKTMLLTLLLALSFGLLDVAFSGNNAHTSMRTKIDLLKLIYNNAKARVTLDSPALKQLIQLSSGK